MKFLLTRITPQRPEYQVESSVAQDCYQPARQAEAPEDCFFYHRTDLPELDALKSDWDLRHCVDQYLGEVNYSNQRVLDVGTASGFLSFEMEERGANVVSFDMPSAAHWDFVPHYQLAENWEEDYKRHARDHQRLQNAYWYLHARNQSSAQVHYGDIYKLPVELGNFDTVFMGMILGHLRDPFQAIYSASRLCRSTMVITNQVDPKTRWWRKKKKPATAYFMPSQTDVQYSAWWGLNTECIERMLGTLGFKSVQTVVSKPKCLIKNRYQEEKCVAIVAKRFAGEPAGLELNMRRAA